MMFKADLQWVLRYGRKKRNDEALRMMPDTWAFDLATAAIICPLTRR
jgi:hypothetical protein